MVALFSSPVWLLAQSTVSAEKMPPPTKAVVLMALIAILLLGLLLVVIILLGGNWVRKWGTHRRGPAVPPDLLLQKNLSDNSPDDSPPDASTFPKESADHGDTVAPDETRTS